MYYKHQSQEADDTFYYIRWFITVQLYAVVSKEAPLSRGLQSTHTRNDIKYKKKVLRVLRHAVTPAGDPNPQARLGVGRYPTQRPLERSRGPPL